MRWWLLAAIPAFIVAGGVVAQVVTPAVNSPLFTGTPSVGSIPIATSSTTAAWNGQITGNTNNIATTIGSLTNGHCVSIDSNSNLIDAGGACTIGGGGGTVNAGTAGQLAYYASSSNAVSGLAAGGVTGAMIGSGTVTGSNIASATVAGSNIASATVAGSNIASATIAGSNIAANTVANSNLANMTANTVKCNSTNGSAAPTDCVSTIWTPDGFGVVDRTGATDMGGLINSAIAAAKNCGANGTGTVYLRAGTYLITTAIVPKSCMSIVGDGPGKTILLTNSAAPFGPPTGQQLVHFILNGVTFKDSGTHASATVMTFPNLQDARLNNIDFYGYTTGTLASFSTSAVSSFDDTNAVWNNSNIIFNVYSNWMADSCGTCITEAGHYGTTPTASPASSSNVPDQVVTQNRFDNIVLYNVGSKCLDFVKANDTEFATNIFCAPNSNSAIPVQFGDDNANFPGNNYVNSIRVQITISIKSPATTSTFFRAGDWTYGNVVDLETDLTPSSAMLATAQANVTQFKLEVCGKNPFSGFIDAAGFNTNRICVSNNFSGSGDGQSSYYRVGNGTSALPVWGFANDSTNGVYLPAAGIFGISKPTMLSGGGELATSLVLCNSTSRGSLAVVTDSNSNTWGSTFGGSGGNVILAFCDGTSWKVAGI